ncbi:hypothetical protein GOODEAATRI_031957, partial [Goodea atripinnis]
DHQWSGAAGPQVGHLSEVGEPLSGRGISQPVLRGRRQAVQGYWRCSVPAHRPAGVPGLSPDLCGLDDGPPDRSHHLPAHPEAQL